MSNKKLKILNMIKKTCTIVSQLLIMTLVHGVFVGAL